MPEVEIPRKSFTPHPTGVAEGTIVGVEVEYNVITQFGSKNRVTLRIMSDKPLKDDLTGATKTLEDGTPLYCHIWDRFNIAGGPRATMTKRRIQILGRQLTPEEVNGYTCDTDGEFLGVRVGYVVVHNPNTKDPSAAPFANIDTIYRLEDQSIPADHQDFMAEKGIAPAEGSTTEKKEFTRDEEVDNSSLIETIMELEVELGWSKEEKGTARSRYLGELGITRASAEELNVYRKILMDRADKDSLPF